jgi:hypothetical protein
MSGTGRLLWVYCSDCGRERDVDPSTLCRCPATTPFPRSPIAWACGSRKITTRPELYPMGIEAMRARWGGTQRACRT